VQAPWVVNGTVCENIVFGAAVDDARFTAALRLSCLDSDVAALAAGGDTGVGDRGLTLSGGQKARVAFARCVYKEADLFVFDDPLSAVDAAVAERLFEDAIVGELKTRRRKTVILATNQSKWARHPAVDMVVVMEIPGLRPSETAILHTRVPLTLFWEYARLCLPLHLLALYGALVALCEGANFLAERWLPVLATPSALPFNTKLWLFGALAAVWLVPFFSRALLFSRGARHASHSLHAQLLLHILRCPLAFFDRTPLGQLINRFSTDMRDLDTRFPVVNHWALHSLLKSATQILLLCIATPVLALFILPLFC
jgi:ABC-type multidrug transport system fused ATPase/permease subunit